MKILAQRAIDLPSSGGNVPAQNGNGAMNININQNSDSLIDLSAMPTINSMAAPNLVPPTLAQTIVSNVGSGADVITAYFLNEDTYNATPSDNGSAASSVSDTYSDGWFGNGYNKLAASVNQGNGIRCYGMTFVYLVTFGRVQDATGLNGSDINFLTATFVGNRQAPSPMPLNAGIRNTQFQDGTMTVKANFFLSAADQIAYSVPVGDTVGLTVLTRPFNN